MASQGRGGASQHHPAPGRDSKSRLANAEVAGLDSVREDGPGRYGGQGASVGFRFTAAPIKIVESFPGSPNTLGRFNPATGEVEIRADQAQDPVAFLGTVYHEQLHAYQYQVTRRFDAHQIAPTDPLYFIAKEWSDNWKSYKDSKTDYVDYFNQPIEAHAHEGGQSFMRFVERIVNQDSRPSVSSRVARAAGRSTGVH